MTISNVHTFELNQIELLTEAIELTGTHDLGGTIAPELLPTLTRSLNLYSKSWQAKGLFLHTYQEATLFLAAGQQSYLLGATGDHATESFIETTLSA